VLVFDSCEVVVVQGGGGLLSWFSTRCDVVGFGGIVVMVVLLNGSGLLPFVVVL